LIWLRGTEDVSAELDQIKKEVAEEESAGEVSLIHLFTKRELRKPLVIACMLMIGQQLSGINAVSLSPAHNTQYSQNTNYKFKDTYT